MSLLRVSIISDAPSPATSTTPSLAHAVVAGHGLPQTSARAAARPGCGSQGSRSRRSASPLRADGCLTSHVEMSRRIATYECSGTTGATAPFSIKIGGVATSISSGRAKTSPSSSTDSTMPSPTSSSTCSTCSARTIPHESTTAKPRSSTPSAWSPSAPAERPRRTRNPPPSRMAPQRTESETPRSVHTQPHRSRGLSTSPAGPPGIGRVRSR